MISPFQTIKDNTSVKLDFGLIENFLKLNQPKLTRPVVEYLNFEGFYSLKHRFSLAKI
jgi:hypothetical protein